MSAKRKIARAVLDVLVVLCVLCLSSCTHQHGQPYVEAPDAGADSDSDSDTDAGADAGANAGGEWVCPSAVLPPCPSSGWPNDYGLWGEAADFGEGYAFVDVEHEDAFLAERPDVDGGTEPVLVARSWDQPFEDVPGDHLVVALAEPPSEPLHPVALVASSGLYNSEWGFNPDGNVVGYPAVALLCGDSGCALYGVVEESIGVAHLGPIPGGAVPIEGARGLVHFNAVHWEESPDDPVCAFGDGIACFDGTTWTTVLGPGGPILLAATLAWEDSSSSYLVAAGEQCRLVRQSDAGFEEIPLGCDVDLKAVEEEWELFAAAGDGILVLGFPEKTLECAWGVDVVALRLRSYYTNPGHLDHRRVTAFAQSGRVLRANYIGFSLWTCAYAEPLDGPARAWTAISPWTDAYGSMVVTESSAYWRIEGGGPVD